MSTTTSVLVRTDAGQSVPSSRHPNSEAVQLAREDPDHGIRSQATYTAE